jgi:DNA-directed RNA polymerase subunit beta'
MVSKPVKQEKKSVFFDAIKIKIASPEKIKEWSFGEVTKPETINYRTFKPERDGLFCAKIFGPVKDWECLCGKYKRMKHRGVTCEKCGVEVIESKVRRTRMGHIELASPVCHVWFFKGSPSRIGALLDLPVRDIERIVYFESFIVTDPKDSGLEKKEVLPEDKYKKKVQELGENKFEVKIGAEAIKELLSKVDVDDLLIELKRELGRTVSVQKKLKLAKRLRVVEAFRKSGNRPEWMVLDVLPVIPPELRPLVPLDGGRFATSDLNDLYRRVINRNNRLKKLLDLSAPEIIVRNEKRMLQEAVDALFDNGRRGRVIRSSNKHPLKSLSDIIKGKQGRFRQNLLGKRVDYSGRSVIVAGPHLKMHQCGIPKMMALELFKPFLYYKLEKDKGAATIKAAKRMVEERDPVVWDVLEEVIKEHPVLLNRAPTLHRLGIQAFEPILVEGKAIQLHPLVCPAFNADFDGDQMAVHVPLSFEAQLEARTLMLSSYNILSPAHGKPLAVPTQDMVLGIYYLTRPMRGAKGAGKVYASPEEVMVAYDQNKLSLHAEIKVRLDGKLVDTTTGRIIIRNILPRQISFSEVNKVLGKKEITALVDLISRKLGNWHCVTFLDDLKALGFRYSTKAGYSICIDDLLVPKEKPRILEKTHKKIEELNSHYQLGTMSHGERYNNIIDEWSAANDETTEYLMKAIKEVGGDATKTKKRERFYNTIYVFADSGARSSKAQIAQLSGMRGLMAKPSGEIIETPITASFREGLTVLQFFDSTHGARKGLADTALKTANSGYLTRRLVDVAQDVIISEEDCGTIDGVEISALIEQNETIEPLGDRILGRYTTEDIYDPINGDDLIVAANTLIMEDEIKKIEKAGVDRVKVRSVLSCDSSFGVCRRCYGLDLATRRIVEIGEAVGTIAAQSIGEPGTQLTMRTFHIGGAASASKEASSHYAKFGGKARYADIRTVSDRKGILIVTSNNGKLELLDYNGRTIETYPIGYGTKLFVEDGRDLKQGELIAEWDPHVSVVLADVAGKAVFEDLIKGENLKEEVNTVTSISSWVVVASPTKDKRQPAVRIVAEDGSSKNFPMPAGSILSVDEGAELMPGDMISKTPRAAQKTKDITVGLPRIAELFEARKAKEIAIVTEIDGEVSIEEGTRSSRKITVENKEIGEKRTYNIPVQRFINVREGDYVKAGDTLTEGLINPHDILSINGVGHLQKHLVDSIQEVYRKQGVSINDKHIEVIVRQMLKKVQIEDPGDSDFMPNEEVYKADFLKETNRLVEADLKPPVGRSIMQGITKAALNTESFISAASFQETTRVLTDAACSGKTDTLKGLKENVIMGKLIPAGTGSKHVLSERFRFRENE